jgi:hypothetical protein
MTEKRFNANGVVGVMIWKRDWDDLEQPPIPCIRLYEPRDPETGLPQKKPDGSYASFKDYELRYMVDPTIKIIDDHFEFVETEDGRRYFDFSLRTLGKEPPSL